MQLLRCSRCDQILFSHDERFIVRISVSADRDTTADEDGGGAEFRDLLDSLEDDEAGDVFGADRNMAFTLCRKCRRTFLENPLNVEGPAGVSAARVH